MTDNKGIIILICVIIVVIVIVAVIGFVMYNNNKKSDEEETKTNDTKQSAPRAEYNVADPGTSGAQSIDNTEQVMEQVREKFPQVFIAFKKNDELHFVTTDFSLSTNFENAQYFELEGDYLWKDGSYFGINGMTTNDEEKVSVKSPIPEVHRFDLAQLHIACLTIIDEMVDGEILLLSLIEILQDKNVNISGNNDNTVIVNGEVKNQSDVGYAFYALNDSSVILKDIYIDGIPEKNNTLNSELDIKEYVRRNTEYNAIEVRSVEPNQFGNYDYETRYLWQTPDNRQLISGAKQNKAFIPVEYHNLYILADNKFIEYFPFDPLSIKRGNVTIGTHMYNAPLPIEFKDNADYETIPYGPYVNYLVATNYFTDGREKGIPFVYEYDGRSYKILPRVHLLYRINNDGTMFILVKWENDEIEEVEYNKDRVSNNNILTHGITLEDMFERYPKNDFVGVDQTEINATMRTLEQIEPLLAQAEELAESTEMELFDAKIKKFGMTSFLKEPTVIPQSVIEQEQSAEAIEQEQEETSGQTPTETQPALEQFQNFSNMMKRLVK